MKGSLLVCLAIAAAATAAGCGSAAWLMSAAPKETLTTPRTAAAEVAAFDEAQELLAQQRYREAQVRLTPLAPAFEKAGDAERAAKTIFWLAYCHEKQGRTAEAADLYERIINRYPGTPASRQAADRLARLRSAAQPSSTSFRKPYDEMQNTACTARAGAKVYSVLSLGMGAACLRTRRASAVGAVGTETHRANPVRTQS